MKITEIHVNRFGVWNDLSLPTFDSGLNVIYGPNETGKSTLMRFIRGVLYGFGPAGPQVNSFGMRPFDSGGSLRIAHAGEEFDIHRIAPPGEPGVVSINGFRDGEHTQTALEGLLSTTPAAMFERLFAVDLFELQELATLGGQDLADKVYGLTLGPEGRTILDSWAALEQSRRELFDPADQSGRLTRLLGRRDELSVEIESAETRRERHTVLCHERDELQVDIERRKARQLQWQSQLRGHRFLEQAWPSWNRVREIHGELDRLPTSSAFPEDGVSRLAKIEDELRGLIQSRKTTVTAAKQLRAQLPPRQSKSKLLRHAASVEAACDRRDRLEYLLKQQDVLQQQTNEAATKRDAATERVGAGWTTTKLLEIDASPAVQMRLLDAARGYHGRLDYRGRIRRRYKQRAVACSRRARELQDQQKASGATFDEQIAAAKERLVHVETLSGLKRSEAELDLQRAAIAERLSRIEEHPPLPPWAYLVLGFFGVVGAIFAVVGFYTGLTVNGILGLMYALLGISCGGTAYALKTHVERTSGDNAEQLADELREVEVLLRQQREEIARSMNALFDADAKETNGTPWSADDVDDATLNELTISETQQLGDLERLADLEQRNTARRQKLSAWRGKLQQAQRDVTSARQAWCEVLGQLGLQETLRVDEAFEEWQRVLEARDAQQSWNGLNLELTHCRQALDENLLSIGLVAERVEWSEVNDDLPTMLDTWRAELTTQQEQWNGRRGLQREIKHKLREADRLRRRAAKCRLRRAALLSQAGASNRDEFEACATAITRRHELENELFTASAELETICRTEPELAIVEEDMFDFDMDDNAAVLLNIEESLADSESDIQLLFERLGRVKQEISELETDRRGTCLRFNRARIDDELTRATEEWLALELSGRALSATQQQFERDCQPATLAAATKYLTQMTRGRYRNIWAPLGQHSLCVDDEQGRSFRVEQLSGGTKEQLFLAIRLAIVEELTRDGVELPMVLDDVFANFDQSRTEAAVETLQEFAAGGQQILLLTCHVHLARMLDAQGVNAIWLPNSHAGVEERRAG